MEHGLVSLTPLDLDLTHHGELARMQSNGEIEAPATAAADREG